ncbi:hypothetical protein QBC44DRAFT_77782 [Cladorrhinum sp. PSN332]|nr:hypothetical protein QBC44DRAFT_77782 [Cladorrhinum sp. PSN332]
MGWMSLMNTAHPPASLGLDSALLFFITTYSSDLPTRDSNPSHPTDSQQKRTLLSIHIGMLFPFAHIPGISLCFFP